MGKFLPNSPLVFRKTLFYFKFYNLTNMTPLLQIINRKKQTNINIWIELETNFNYLLYLLIEQNENLTAAIVFFVYAYTMVPSFIYFIYLFICARNFDNSWSCKKQNCLAIWSYEAEVMALSEVCIYYVRRRSGCDFENSTENWTSRRQYSRTIKVAWVWSKRIKLSPRLKHIYTLNNISKCIIKYFVFFLPSAHKSNTHLMATQRMVASDYYCDREITSNSIHCSPSSF